MSFFISDRVYASRPGPHDTPANLLGQNAKRLTREQVSRLELL
jgi:hypothetical protein